jgi:hypothetical protein
MGTCDESERNRLFGRELKLNGCAEGQAALKTTSVVIKSCPTAVQL